MYKVEIKNQAPEHTKAANKMINYTKVLLKEQRKILQYFNVCLHLNNLN